MESRTVAAATPPKEQSSDALTQPNLERSHPWLPVAALLVPVGFVLLVLLVQNQWSRQALVGETIEQVDGPLYFGLLSNLAIAAWLVGGTAASFSALVARRLSGHARSSAIVLCAVLGLWTTWLALDDAYTLHESVIPAHTGIHQHSITAVYALFMAGVLYRFRREFIKRDIPLLLTAMLFFGASEVMDVITGTNDALKYLEESLKLLGVVAWAGYLARMGIAAIGPHLVTRT